MRVSKMVLLAAAGLAATAAQAVKMPELRHKGPAAWAYVVGTDTKMSYHVHEGLAVIDDMVVGTAEEVRTRGIRQFYKPQLPDHLRKDGAASGGTQSDNPSNIIGGGTAGTPTSNPRYWPANTVYYSFDAALSAKARQAALDGMNLISTRTAIRFVERTMQTNYVRIFAGSGCYSHIGMVGGAQDLSLGSGCEYAGIAVHELIHALGWNHEQMRPDRDNYITIQTANITAGTEGNFSKLPASSAQPIGTYDFGSIMHYGAYAFSSNGQPTITPNDPTIALNSYGQRNAPSAGDVASINYFYKASSSSSSATSSTQASSSSSAASSASSSSVASSSSSASSVSSSSSSSSSVAFKATPSTTALTMNRNTTGYLPFTVQGSADQTKTLSYSVVISNATLIQATGMRIMSGATAGQKTLSLTPAANRTGTANITLTVTGATGVKSSFTFTLTVK